MGALLFDDRSFCLQISKLLRDYCGCSIQYIGGLDLSQMVLGPVMRRGYDTPQLYREDTLERIKRLEREANESAERMNRTIREGWAENEGRGLAASVLGVFALRFIRGAKDDNPRPE